VGIFEVANDLFRALFPLLDVLDIKLYSGLDYFLLGPHTEILIE